MWDTIQIDAHHLSHDLPCPRCHHAVHTYLAVQRHLRLCANGDAGHDPARRLTTIRCAAGNPGRRRGAARRDPATAR